MGDPTGDCPAIIDPSTFYLQNPNCFVNGNQGEQEYIGFTRLTP